MFAETVLFIWIRETFFIKKNLGPSWGSTRFIYHFMTNQVFLSSFWQILQNRIVLRWNKKLKFYKFIIGRITKLHRWFNLKKVSSAILNARSIFIIYNFSSPPPPPHLPFNLVYRLLREWTRQSCIFFFLFAGRIF